VATLTIKRGPLRAEFTTRNLLEPGKRVLMQFVSGVGSIVTSLDGDGGARTIGGIAFWAHIAGFVAGITGVALFRRPERQRVEWWHDVNR